MAGAEFRRINVLWGGCRRRSGVTQNQHLTGKLPEVVQTVGQNAENDFPIDVPVGMNGNVAKADRLLHVLGRGRIKKPLLAENLEGLRHVRRDRSFAFAQDMTSLSMAKPPLSLLESPTNIRHEVGLVKNHRPQKRKILMRASVDDHHAIA
jgi:hypothetical protein